MQGRRPIPQRYRVRPGDTVALMECRNPQCRAPFDPRFEVPRDRLCVECRKAQREATPVLPGLESLE
ncbi:hypothetical protein [Nocardia sp. NPDC005745]|uniref:hypothetical protein n=1 Tax=Nocardia sp. NPDC005745 TaxID=3157061 RepID=UPI0033D7F3AA